MICRRKKLRRGSDRYGVRKVRAAGEDYRSKLEVGVHHTLLERAERGEIEILQREDRVELHDARFIYTPDFRCRDLETGEEFWVEAKGVETDIWRRNYRLWKFHGPGKLEIYRGSYARHKISEIVIPIDACRACGRPNNNNRGE